MHPRVEQLPKPEPDYHRFLQVLRRERPDHIPLIELAVHPDVVNVLLDEPVAVTGDLRVAVQRNVRLHHRLGYDVVKVSAPIPFDVQRLTTNDTSTHGNDTRNWQDQHDGPIGCMDDLERFPWPTQNDVDFSTLEAATEVLPDGMSLIGFAGGVLEFSMDLIGMERFMLATHRDPRLVAAVIERVGQIIYNVFEVYCQMESVRAVWLGYDLGHKHGPLVSPKLLETLVLVNRVTDSFVTSRQPVLCVVCRDVPDSQFFQPVEIDNSAKRCPVHVLTDGNSLQSQKGGKQIENAAQCGEFRKIDIGSFV